MVRVLVRVLFVFVRVSRVCVRIRMSGNRMSVRIMC